MREVSTTASDVVNQDDRFERRPLVARRVCDLLARSLSARRNNRARSCVPRPHGSVSRMLAPWAGWVHCTVRISSGRGQHNERNVLPPGLAAPASTYILPSGTSRNLVIRRPGGTDLHHRRYEKSLVLIVSKNTARPLTGSTSPLDFASLGKRTRFVENSYLPFKPASWERGRRIFQ